MVHSDDAKRRMGVTDSGSIRDYQMLFQRKIEADGVDHRAMGLAPLSYWLCDTLDPERVLTVGAGCELLHITMCEKAQNHVMQAVCVHIAERFSPPFLEARKAFGSAQSQLQVPDPSALLMGVKGQFDLIFVFSAEPFSQAKLDNWKSALTTDGILVVCSEADGDMPTGDGMMNWQFGPHKLLIAAPARVDGRVSILEHISEALTSSHSSLSNALAASMVDLTLKAKNAGKEYYESELQALKKGHAVDLISVTKKLADTEEENIALRRELKSKTTQLEALQPEVPIDVEQSQMLDSQNA